jgi:hypothetical protein
VPGSTFWHYIQECVHAHFRRHPRQPQDVEAILATIREDLLRVPDDTVLHDSPRVTAIDLKIVFTQSEWTGATPGGFFEWALHLLGSVSGSRVWTGSTIQKNERERFWTSDLPPPKQQAIAGKQYVLVASDLLTKFRNNSNLQEFVDPLLCMALPCTLIFTCAGNIGSGESLTVSDSTFWAAVTIDLYKAVSVRISEQTGAGKPIKAAAAAQDAFKKKAGDILKKAGQKNGNIRTVYVDQQHGDITQFIARTASFLFGCNMPSDRAIIALIRPWLYSILTAGSALALGSRESPSKGMDGHGPAGGGQSALGDDGRPGPPDAAGGTSRSGTGGDGGDGGCGGDGGHCGGPSDKGGGGGCDVGSRNDVDNNSDSASDCDIDSGEMHTIEAREKNQEQIWEMQRQRVRDSIHKKCQELGLKISSDIVDGFDSIIGIYQAHDVDFEGVIKWLDHHTIILLAEYNGVTTNALLPGTKLGIMMSTRWRTKARLKNDPALRQAFNMLEMASRTKHLAVDGLNKMEPVRMFKFGASYGLVSSDQHLKNKSHVLGFTTIKAHGEGAKSLLDAVKEGVGMGVKGVPALSDECRLVSRQVVFATKVLNSKGLFLGPTAFKCAERDHAGNITFLNLSNSVLFPVGENPHSRQSLSAVPLMNRQNTSLRWDPLGPQEGGPRLYATFINESTVYDVMSKAKQSRTGLGLMQPFEDLPCGDAMQKLPSFQQDQQCVANLLVEALLGHPDSAEISADTQSALKKLTRVARHEAKDDAAIQAIDRLAELFVQRGSKVTSTQVKAVCKAQPAIKRLAEFVYKSLRQVACTTTTKFTSAEAGDHLFLTACISDPELNNKVNGHGFIVEECPFTLPATWQMLPTCPYLGTLTECPYLGKLLPRVIVKTESPLKGTGVFAGRRIEEGELVMIYLGDFVTDAEARPSTRMIVRQTWGDKWVYCFGTESLQTCLDVGPALGSYANSPGPGEVPNCKLARKAVFKCRDDKGAEKIGYPMTASKVIEKGQPVLWTYPPTAGRGANFA